MFCPFLLMLLGANHVSRKPFVPPMFVWTMLKVFVKNGGGLVDVAKWKFTPIW